MTIRVGIGGWDYGPWRGTFYPDGLPKARQLEFASRAVTAIEINATFYKLQSRDLYERWAAAVPDDFVFALKGSRFCTNRRVLAEGGEAVARFCGQGFTALGGKLGPILWQLAETKTFEPDDIRAFFDLLPRQQDGLVLRHAIEARHESFRDPLFKRMARDAGIAVCQTDGEIAEVPAEPTAGFAYVRLKRAREEEPAGYAAADLDAWAATARRWGDEDHDMFIFVVNGAKVRAPAAAQALLARFRGQALS